jgi:hypothetical protein
MSRFPGESHDLAGRHRDVAATSKPLGKLAASSPSGPGFEVTVELCGWWS